MKRRRFGDEPIIGILKEQEAGSRTADMHRRHGISEADLPHRKGQNSKLRRAVRTRGHFPNAEAALTLPFLVLNHAGKDWKRPPREWTAARARIAVILGGRFATAITA